MKAKRRIAYILLYSLVAALLGSLALSAQAQETPLPASFTIVPPDPSIPPAVAAFSGKWVGKWESVLDGTLVVLKIHPANAKGAYKTEVIYSWGVSRTWYIFNPGYRELEGEIKDGTLEIVNGRVNLQYRLSDDQNTLTGAYRTRTTTPGVFRRVAD